MRVTELSFEVPGHPGTRARALLARLADKHAAQIAPAFWHRDAHGHTLGHKPPIAIFGTQRKIVVRAYGDAGLELLLGAATLLAEMLMREFGRFPRPQYQTVDMEWNPCPGMRKHVCESFCFNLPRSLQTRGTLWEQTPEIETLLRRRVADELADTCARAGVDAPDLRPHVEKSLRIHTRWSVKVHGDRYYAGAGIAVELPGELQGPWQIGALQARGLGRI